jgi:two-component system phosphate regulon response regulator PhoB
MTNRPSFFREREAAGCKKNMAKPRILIIEDERGLADVLTYNLQREGYETLVAHDGQEGLRKAQMQMPDLILLDIMLPGIDGLEVCRTLRAGKPTSKIPILMLTAKSEETDQIVGFTVGADDYVTKPFSVKVLLQRIRALKRRADAAPESNGDLIEYCGITIDKVKHRVRANGEDLDLTPTEFRLLECMLRQPGRAFTRAQLMDSAIEEGALVLERTIDVHIKSLRRKLGDKGDAIETVRGVGYRFQEAPGPRT